MEKTILNQSQKTGKVRKKSKRAQTIFLICLLAFPLAHFIVFYVGVNFNSIILAFKKYSPDTATYSFLEFSEFFKNFQMFFSNFKDQAVLGISFKNSMILYGVGLVVGMPLNILIAFCMFKKIPMEKAFRVIIFLPSIISAIVFVLIFKYFIDYGTPPIWRALGLGDAPALLFEPQYAFGTIVFYGLWTGFGSSVILYSNAMTRIPESLIEYGKLEGMKPFKELWYIVLPMIFPTITTFLVTGIAGIFINQGAIYSFFGEHAESYTYTFGYYMFVQVIGAKSSPANYPYAAAMGLLFTLFAAPITLFAKWGLERVDPSAEY